MKLSPSRILTALAAAIVLPFAIAHSAMVIESLSGAVTSNEVNSFKTYMASRTMANDMFDNQWGYGASGTDMEALGQVYEITGDVAILDRMIQYADKVLSIRNDPTTGRVMWTGKREPVWPNDPMGDSCAGSEQGDVLGHMAYCAKLILLTPEIWSTTVAVGDPLGYGSTYKTRAQRYVTEVDKTLDEYVTPYFVDAGDSNHYRFPSDTRYTGATNGAPIPWNQQAMLSNAYLNMADCHQLLKDCTSRQTLNRSIVNSNMDWFLGDLVPYTVSGKTVYDWGYSLGRTSEDMGHASYDMLGICRAYTAGLSSATAEDLTNFANTTYYVIWNSAAGTFHARVDGTEESGDLPASTIQQGFIGLCRYSTSPDLYTLIATQDTAYSLNRPIYWASIMTEKHRVDQKFLVQSLNDSRKVTDSSSVDYVLTVEPTGEFSGTVTLSASGLPSGASASFNPSTISGASGSSVMTITTSSTTPDGTSTITISGTNGSTVRQTTASLIVDGNLALNKTATASSTWSSTYAASKSVDANTGTRWSAASGQTANQWVAIDIGSGSALNRVVIKEITFQRVTAFKLQSSDDGVNYTDIPGTAGTTIGAAKTVKFESVTTRYLRLYMTSASNIPNIDEIAAYNDSDLALDCAAYASSNWNSSYDESKAFDGSDSSRWSAASGQSADQWVAVDVGVETTFSRVWLREISFPRVTAYKLQMSDDGINFTDISATSGTTIGASKLICFTPVIARYMRLFITSASGTPTINAIQVY